MTGLQQQISTSDEALLPASCDWCPRACGANRAAGEAGFCGADNTLRIARAALHFWEEPCLSGERGSGAVFFTHCPLRCVYCQNAHIADGTTGKPITIDRLAEIFLELQDAGALNINLVTPTHYAAHIRRALTRAKAAGLHLPVAFNTSGYETVAAVRAAKDTADIWLTDFKYASLEVAAAYSHAADYPQVALAALDAMVVQTGSPEFDEVDGEPRLLKGVIVRHLLLPRHLEDSKRVVQLLHDRYGDDICLSLMNQYTPIISPDSSAAKAHPELLQRVSSETYEELLDFADEVGFTEYYWQDGAAAEESFIPAFDYTGVDAPAALTQQAPEHA